MKKIDLEHIDAKNAKVLADLVAEPTTPENLKVQILNKLLESAQSENFFDAIFKENLDLGSCPNCGHENNWLIPENELNKRGVVSSDADPRVPVSTDESTCPKWQEACKKKKITI